MLLKTLTGSFDLISITSLKVFYNQYMFFSRLFKMAEDAKLKSAKVMVRSVLQSVKDGVPARRLSREYLKSCEKKEM